MLLQVTAGEGWEDWIPVESFARSHPGDRHYLLDEASGELIFGPAVREPDGTFTQYGGIPPAGAVLRVGAYRTGGGRRGNVARRAIGMLRSSIPFVAGVENRKPARGGVDGEDLTSAKLRGPMLLRTRDRAVTAEDYEYLAIQGAPEAARVRCVAAGDGADAGSVRVLVIPSAVEDQPGRLLFEQLVPGDETLARIARYLDELRHRHHRKTSFIAKLEAAFAMTPD